MNTEKFTPGEWAWYITDSGDGYPAIFNPKMEEDIANVCIVNHDTEQSFANAALISAAPEMYRNEEKNLEILKIVQDVYSELKYLITHDSDVKTCLPSLPEDTFDYILKKIKIRIIKTEKALKKAKGEE